MKIFDKRVAPFANITDARIRWEYVTTIPTLPAMSLCDKVSNEREEMHSFYAKQCQYLLNSCFQTLMNAGREEITAIICVSISLVDSDANAIVVTDLIEMDIHAMVRSSS